jgi:plasmid maintenance system antidote protein VapI
MEGGNMDLRKEFKKAIDTGLPISFVARKIDKDPSTLNKWLHGTRKVSQEIEDAVEQVLLEIKEQWRNIL